MRKNWWWFRLAVLSFAMVGLGWYLFHASSWRKALGIQPDYRAQIAEGDGIVRAIYDFHYRTLLWPEYLEDAYPASPHFRWFYEIQTPPGAARVPALSTSAPGESGRTHLSFAFGSESTQGDWHVFDGSHDRIERAGSPDALHPLAHAAHGLNPIIYTLEELDKRIAREPMVLEHRRDKASLLVLEKRLPEAGAVIDEAVTVMPSSAWPRLARAALALKESGAGSRPVAGQAVELPVGVRDYTDWATAHPSFTRLWGTSWLERQLPDDSAAALAAAKALEQPIEVDADDTHIAAFYLWDLCRWALQTERWELCVTICDSWERACEAEAVKDQSYFGFRAAARVGEGQFDAARRDLDQAQKAEQAWISAGGAAGESLSFLRDAAARKDARSRLTFPPYPGEYSLFVRPQ